MNKKTRRTNTHEETARGTVLQAKRYLFSVRRQKRSAVGNTVKRTLSIRAAPQAAAGRRGVGWVHATHCSRTRRAKKQSSGACWGFKAACGLCCFVPHKTMWRRVAAKPVRARAARSGSVVTPFPAFNRGAFSAPREIQGISAALRARTARKAGEKTERWWAGDIVVGFAGERFWQVVVWAVLRSRAGVGVRGRSEKEQARKKEEEKEGSTKENPKTTSTSIQTKVARGSP
mmetsp:Transcript_21581/g.66968  ORF Transcript_21581/g.66968 Transcript_21581/m.66968 type:complete len:231 (-) Transcript_21581:855-1547(-)